MLSASDFAVAGLILGDGDLDLLTQDRSLEDVQYIGGHAELRLTGLHDRRQKKVTRNIVERISI